MKMKGGGKRVGFPPPFFVVGEAADGAKCYPVDFVTWGYNLAGKERLYETLKLNFKI